MKHRKVQRSNESATLKAGGAHHRESHASGHHGRPRISHPKTAARSASKGRSLIARIFAPPILTPGRIRFAFAVAVIGDVVQVAASPFDGWTWLGQAVAILVALLTIPALGIRLLTLLTLVLELVPAADVLPMWTACIAIVVALRKGE